MSPNAKNRIESIGWAEEMIELDKAGKLTDRDMALVFDSLREAGMETAAGYVAKFL